MKPEQFEKRKQLNRYELFMQTALGYQNLSMQDYATFMLVVFEIAPQRQDKDPIQMYEKEELHQS